MTQGSRMGLGIGIALGGHLLTVAVGTTLAVATPGSSEDALLGMLVVTSIGQLVLFVASLVAGIWLNVRGDGDLGNGIIIGWAIGLLVTPVVGFGACVLVAGQVGG